LQEAAVLFPQKKEADVALFRHGCQRDEKNTFDMLV
jgi:hypothetical protein